MRASRGRCLALLEKLDNQAVCTPEEAELAELLTLLVEAFERRHYALPAVTPLETVRVLMEAHELRQKDLTDVFGTPRIVSEVLRGKRPLTVEHIRRLAARFRVSPAVFLQRSPNVGPRGGSDR